MSECDITKDYDWVATVSVTKKIQILIVVLITFAPNA